METKTQSSTSGASTDTSRSTKVVVFPIGLSDFAQYHPESHLPMHILEVYSGDLSPKEDSSTEGLYQQYQAFCQRFDLPIEPKAVYLRQLTEYLRQKELAGEMIERDWQSPILL